MKSRLSAPIADIPMVAVLMLCFYKCRARCPSSRFYDQRAFYDPLEDKIFDFVGGQEDLKNKLVRFIGDPAERIKEDHLRIIRAIRFKNTFGFQYHPETYNALKTHAKLSAKVSSERIREELNKMIVHESFPHAVNDMEDTGVLAEVLPEIQVMKGVAQPIEFHTEGDVYDHTLRALKALKPTDQILTRWAVFLHDVGKPETFKIAERIRFDQHSEASAETASKILRRLKFSSKDIKNNSVARSSSHDGLQCFGYADWAAQALVFGNVVAGFDGSESL